MALVVLLDSLRCRPLGRFHVWLKQARDKHPCGTIPSLLGSYNGSRLLPMHLPLPPSGLDKCAARLPHMHHVRRRRLKLRNTAWHCKLSAPLHRYLCMDAAKQLVNLHLFVRLPCTPTTNASRATRNRQGSPTPARGFEAWRFRMIRVTTLRLSRHITIHYVANTTITLSFKNGTHYKHHKNYQH